MKAELRQHSARSRRTGKIADLRASLVEAQATLHAIRRGEVDAVVVASGRNAPRIFTLEGAEHAYRTLVESINEGALTLTKDRTILYANQCFARMVKHPLEQVMGQSFHLFLSPAENKALRSHLKRAAKSGFKMQGLIKAGDGSEVPVLISVRALAKNSSGRATIAMIVTDMTQARASEEMLRALSHRLMKAQESERARVALELHDQVTQLLCAIIARSQVLADKLPLSEKPLGDEISRLIEMLGQVAREVERISRDLRPSVLDELGLVSALRGTCMEFADRTGIDLKLASTQLKPVLSANAELALYRILQKALDNVKRHARAHHVNVELSKRDALVRLAIRDDGIGFDPARSAAGQNENGGFGLLRMRERAFSVGGILNVKSAPGKGTTIEVRVPSARRGGGGIDAHVTTFSLDHHGTHHCPAS